MQSEPLDLAEPKIIKPTQPPIDTPQSTAKKIAKRLGLVLLIVILLGFLIPQPTVIPVQGATRADWNQQTFWYHPWGRSGVHKGIDIFAKQDTPVLATTSGLVIAVENLTLGGKTISILGPKWRVHYYAHLSRQHVKVGTWVGKGDTIGAVGTSGNAAGKQPHLHYAAITLVPYLWRITSQKQGWKKAIFLDPNSLF